MQRSLTLVALLVLVAACAAGGADNGSDGTTTPEGPVAITVTAPVGAANTGFVETEFSVPADTPFTIHFVNEDTGIPHNVQILEGEGADATLVWGPEGGAVITGPDEADYQVPGLSAGTYMFNCLTHPATMVGTLTVG